MKRLLGLLTCTAALVGTFALAAPSKPTPNWNTHSCGKGRTCFYEPDATCPPCFALKHCGPDCGCIPVPGCTL